MVEVPNNKNDDDLKRRGQVMTTTTTMWQEQHLGTNHYATQSVEHQPIFYQNGVYTKSLGFNTKPQKYLKTSRLIQSRIEYALLYGN